MESPRRKPGKTVLAAIFLAGTAACSTPQDATQTMKNDAVEIENKITQLLDTLTLEQKVAQMIQGEIRYMTPDDARRYGIGSVLNGGGAFPNDDKYASLQDWVDLADAYYQASLDTSMGGAGIPIFWGTDAVHGNSNLIGATLFPHNIGLGAANDPDLVRRIGEATAREIAASGIDWTFAPTVAVAKDDRWGRTYEAYSDRPEIVARLAPQLVNGLHAENILANAKHFIGDGGTYRGIDQGDTRVDLETLLAEHGPGYTATLDAGVQIVMASFNSWNGYKVHGHRRLLTEVLKEDMGFDGMVISDWNGIGQVDGCSNESCPQAFNAGIDMAMVTDDWEPLLLNTIEQVKSGIIPTARINDAVRRILRVKYRAGIMDAPKPSERKYVGDSALMGHADHRATAREAVRKSLVLLKNNHQLLPLKPGLNVAVAGMAADDIGQQAGGWTISWQGTGNTNSDFPGAKSIYQGIKDAVESTGGKVSLNQQGELPGKPDVAIVVFGETPYAEGQGDVETLGFNPQDKSHLEIMREFKRQGVPVVAVLITGRPLWVNAELNAADAFVVAWLPGSEGGGVADVLFRDAQGKAQYDFTGRLSFDWPAIDVHRNNGDLPVDEYLFEYGYGLSVADDKVIAADLDEQPATVVNNLDAIVFSRGTKQPWKAMIGDSSNWQKPYGGGQVSSAYEELTVRAVDRRIQEDSLELRWSGDGNRLSQFYWMADEREDFSALLEANASLTMVVLMRKHPQGKVSLRMDCRWPCSGALDLTPTLQKLTAEQWVRLSIPLACFRDLGADLSKVNAPLVLATDKPMTLLINEVAIKLDVSEDSKISCGAFTNNLGK